MPPSTRPRMIYIVFGMIAPVFLWLLFVANSLRPEVPSRGGGASGWAPIDRYAEKTNRREKPVKKPEKTKLRPTKKPAEEDSTEADENEDKEEMKQTAKQSPIDLINAKPIDFSDTTLLDACSHTFSEASLNMKYVKKLTKVFDKINSHWWLDEGGLIGASRAGGMTNADDDFDFFALLPNQVHPCSETSHACTKEEFNKMIHGFLLEFWNEGMCVNNFHPDLDKFDSQNKLMYSLMLDRNTVYQPNAKTPGAKCFEHGKTPRFAHMHLAMYKADGTLATNIWAKGHKHDFIPVSVVLPTKRCRTGALEAPCPNNIPLFLKLRNEGEYNRSSSQGNCLLVRRKWSAEKKNNIMQLTKNLHSCGYNSMYSLIKPAIASGFNYC